MEPSRTGVPTAPGVRPVLSGSSWSWPHRLHRTVTGLTSRESGRAEFQLPLRPLGNVTGDLNTNIDDQSEINNQLNGLPVTRSFRDLDLTGDGTNVNIDDQAIINDVLNGVTIP